MATVFTSAVNSRVVPGGSFMVQATLTGPSSYTTNGVALTADLFSLSNIENLIILGISGGLIGRWDRVNSKILLRFPTGGASAPSTLTAPVAAAPAIGSLAVSGAPALGTISATVPAGGTTVTSTSATPAMTMAGAPAIGSLAVSGAPAAPALTAGLGLEVANATDVSSITIEVLVFGR